MLSDLSESLRALLKSPSSGLSVLAGAEVAFDRPGDGFNPTQTTLNVYLYDIRENTELRTSETPFQRFGNNALYSQRAPLRVAATYLVTAWSGRTGETAVLLEQQLLSQALVQLARFPRLPASCLKGELIDQTPELPVISGQAEGLKNPSEFWTSLNNKLRPSITVTITVSMPLALPITAPLVTNSEIVLKSGVAQRTDPVRADVFEIGGRVIDSTAVDPANAAIAGIAISISGQSQSTTSDAEGRYRIGRLARGEHRLLAKGNGMTKEFTIQVPGAALDAYDLPFK